MSRFMGYTWFDESGTPVDGAGWVLTSILPPCLWSMGPDGWLYWDGSSLTVPGSVPEMVIQAYETYED